jgi:hypothetical protein
VKIGGFEGCMILDVIEDGIRGNVRFVAMLNTVLRLLYYEKGQDHLFHFQALPLC